jgi:GT2 family glycosyltransferase/ubiquinone/menaquinone biosynthesis C-methylase UbiE
MEFTGERFVPGVHGVIEIEHVHRYLYASRLANDKVILDIASGEGYGSAILAAHASKVIGVDISPEAIEHARGQYRRDNLEFRVGTCSEIPLDDASVDLIVSFETLEHHDQHDKMLAEMKRVLRPRGLLLLSSPDKLHYTVETRRLNPYHVKELYKSEFEALLSKHFKNTAYLAQRVLYGSGIFASQTPAELNSYVLSKEIIKESTGLSDPTYWIAFASDHALPKVTSSVLEQPLDEMEILHQTKQALAEHERLVIHLTEGVRNRDGQIADLSQKVIDRDIRVAQLSEGVGFREGQISSLNQSVVDREQQIENLEQRLNRATSGIEVQPFQNSLLRAAAFTPLELNFPNAWVGHLPFGAWLIETLSPRIFVELGTHSGNSFFSFCQAVAQSGIPTRCYAVDTWQGDEHAGQYDEAIFSRVSAHQQKHYREFSRLLRMKFDEARDYFSNGSISLLHIDGLHTYEAVRWDFESWLPKLAPGAVVLFHDTNVRERNFGVWKLWNELQRIYPLNLEFVHSHGLGVLQMNNATRQSRLPWLEPGSPEKQKIVDFFASLGSRHLDLAEAVELREQVAKFNRMWAEQDGHIIWRDGQIARLNQIVIDRDVKIAELTNQADRDAKIAELTNQVDRAKIAELTNQVATYAFSHSWRITAPLRRITRTFRRAISARAGESAGADRKTANASTIEHLAPFFDAAWYLKTNPDVKATGMDPFEHFVQKGGLEGRNPHPIFDAKWYLAKNPDVLRAGLNPLDHFARHGWKEGRNPHPLFNLSWYIETYPDIGKANVNPLQHYIHSGAMEGRRPHQLFDADWYLEKNPDVRSAAVNPLVHFLEDGWKEGRNPHPDFDLKWYLDTYPDVRTAGINPLIHYVEFGAPEGRLLHPEISTTPNSPDPVAIQPEDNRTTTDTSAFDIKQYLPQGQPALEPPTSVIVDIIIPVYRGLEETRRCINSVLGDADRPAGLIRVIDDCSPEPELSAWLSALAATGAIQLSKNSENLGFVRTVNRGMAEAGQNDVILLNSDTEVPRGFARRLAGCAYSKPNVASVTPFSNTAGEMAGFPDKICRPLPSAYSMTAIDQACEEANGQRCIEIPTGVGFCMYIRRACLDEIGSFDADEFGRGYGEETDFCRRAIAIGWCHLLACNTFVYHVGEVSFGQDAPERNSSWNKLVSRYPDLPSTLVSHLVGQPTVPPVFAATAALFHASPRPTVLIVNHHSDSDDNTGYIDDVIAQVAETANVLGLHVADSFMELSVLTIPGHPTLKFPCSAVCDSLAFLNACSVSRIQIQHWISIVPALHQLIDRLSVPVDLTAHGHFSA